MSNRYAQGGTTAMSGSSPIEQLQEGIPSNSIASSLSARPVSVAGVLHRWRMKALTSERAYETLHDLLVTRMRQEAEVLVHKGELVAAAKKLEALDPLPGTQP